VREQPIEIQSVGDKLGAVGLRDGVIVTTSSRYLAVVAGRSPGGGGARGLRRNALVGIGATVTLATR
jgi:hypothetical protein